MEQTQQSESRPSEEPKQPPKRFLNKDEIRRVYEISEQLGETDPIPQRLITDIARFNGLDFVEEILRQTLEIEANGGLMVNSGERRRTPGGVFFYLARGKMPSSRRYKIWPWRNKTGENGGENGSYRREEDDDPNPVFDWESRAELADDLIANAGEVSSLKVTLVGQLGSIKMAQPVVTLTITNAYGNVTVPRGIPDVPTDPETYTIYVVMKLWSRVAPALKAQPDDIVIVDGICSYDDKARHITIYASSITTSSLQRAAWNAQREQQSEESSA
jgi:hypothetical protein